MEKEPDQLLSMIAEDGGNLSGGQRQRLAIARAMVRKPDVILLDEATSALDNESEAGVQEALDVLARKGSALVIAHRLSTIMDSETIIVMGGTKDGDRQGTVLETGTHAELITKEQEPADDGDTDGDDASSIDTRAKTDLDWTLCPMPTGQAIMLMWGLRSPAKQPCQTLAWALTRARKKTRNNVQLRTERCGTQRMVLRTRA